MMEQPKRHILVIEDDHELSEAIVGEMIRRGYGVDHASDGAQGLAKARQQEFDLLIVDRLLPEVDGLSIIPALQREKKFTPALIISALDDVDERVRGLEAGADDYLTKPFSFAELGARVEALLRRPNQSQRTFLQVGGLYLDLLARRARLNDEGVDLTVREFQLLEYFVRRPGQLITRDMLLKHVWKLHFSPQTNVVDVHISKLRRKIDVNRDVSFIKNIRGVGFLFDAEG